LARTSIKAQVEVRFENIRLGSDGLAIRSDRFVGTGQAVQDEPEIEPCLVVVGSLSSAFFSSDSAPVKSFFWMASSACAISGGLVVDAFLVMADGGVGLREGDGARG